MNEKNKKEGGEITNMKDSSGEKTEKKAKMSLLW